MELSQNQIDSYNKTGFLIVESLFLESEISELKKKANRFNNLKEHENVIREKNGEIRSIFAPHKTEDAFKWLYRQKRLVKPAEILIGNEVYLYQFKLNNKQALGGEYWEWHQDFPYWHIDDGVKAPNMVSVMILFQDTDVIQGPLLLIPGSHKNGIVDFEYKEHLMDNINEQKELSIINSLNSDLKYTVNKNLIHQLSKNEKIVIAEGKIGTCIFFHPNLFHASNANLSLIERNTAIVTYNDVNNLPENGAKKRPDFLCSRDYAPVKNDDSKLIVT